MRKPEEDVAEAEEPLDQSERYSSRRGEPYLHAHSLTPRTATDSPIFNAGPSAAARSKAVAKRKKSAGLVLAGRSAKLKRGAQLRARGVNEELIEEELQGVGLPGEDFLVSGELVALGTLPDRFSIAVLHGDAARTALKNYHNDRCNGAPDTQKGMQCALAVGWTAPQQKLALEGRNWHDGPMCNLAVVAVDKSGSAGIMAIAYHSHACLVQAIHVTLRARGPARLPEHLWVLAKQELTEMPTPQQPNHMVGSGCGSRGARAAAREHRACGSSCASVGLRVQLEMACCQSKKGAEFWMGRCGWDGSEDSRKALRRWMAGDSSFSSKTGQYEMWYDILPSSPPSPLPCPVHPSGHPPPPSLPPSPGFSITQRLARLMQNDSEICDQTITASDD